jgi:hypothetical protein
MRGNILRQLRELALIPQSGRPEWLAGAEDSVQFLRSHYNEREVLLHAGGPHVLVHAVLAPADALTPPDKDDLAHSWVEREDSWRIERSFRGGPSPEYRVVLEPPMSSPGCKSLIGGEKLVFLRRLSGVQKGPTPIEMSQKLVHALDLHYLPDRDAYCRLNKQGDVEDVISVLRERGETEWGDLTAVTMQSKDLHEYMAVTNTVLFVRFDFTRFAPAGFSSWSDERSVVDEADVHYNTCRMEEHASFANGYIIIRPQTTVEDLIEDWRNEFEGGGKKYATFKFYDRKNSRLVETPCGPGYHVSYFEQSHLPWDISPVFFRPEVLHRFKADPEKYSLNDRSISCRNAWHLDTYDINEAGQVHTYLIYLSRLPYEEQLYWQAFNEWPKADISKRAFTTDIKGEWTTDHDPLLSIKLLVQNLNEQAPGWWKTRAQELQDAARYPATDSVSEWGDEILALDHLIVEGFAIKGLRALAEDNRVAVEKEWGSLKVLEVVLAAMGMGADFLAMTMEPLRELHSLRNPAKAHGDPEGRAKRVSEARKAHHSLRNHFTNLASRCDVALKLAAQTLGAKASEDEA